MEIFESWSRVYPTGSHHVNSFKEWTLFGLARTLTSQVLCSKYKQWHFINPRVTTPKTTPREALLKGLSYEADIVVDVVETNLQDFQQVCIANITIATIPMMVYANDEGSDGVGGFFIVKGIERVLITQIRQAYNQPVTSFAKNESKKNRIKSEPLFQTKCTNELAQQVCSTFGEQLDAVHVSCTVRSISEASNHSCATEVVLTLQNQVLMTNSKFNGRVDVALVLKALGCETREHFMLVALQDEQVATCMWISSFVASSQTDALKQLAAKLSFAQRSIEEYKIDYKHVLNFLTSELFPHLGLNVTPSIVAVYIVSLVKRLFKTRTSGKADERDSLIFKRFETAGMLMHDLFEQIVKKWVSVMNKFCMKKNNLIIGIQPSFISKRVAYCFATGTWGALQGSYKRMGVSQPRANNSYLAQMSHLCRVSNPISKEPRNQLVRQLHPTHAYYICPCESPEGHTIGVVLNFAITAHVTTRVYPVVLCDALAHLLKPITLCGRIIKHTVAINGKLVGQTDNVCDFVREFMYLRRIGMFDGGVNLGMVSIGVREEQIEIWCDDGRVTRPIIARPDKNTDWRTGLLSGQFQWLDVFEQEYGMEKHSEARDLHPCTMFGLTSSNIPFLNFQPVPRAVYASNMNKQAICSIGPCQNERFGHFNIGRIQHVPIVSTIMAEIKQLNKYPTGMNIIVAICPLDGYNQEDAVVLNRASVQRGLFAADSYRTFTAEESIEGEEERRICMPPSKVRNQMYNYCMLDDRGVIKKGCCVKVGDVLIGQVSRTAAGYEDISVTIGKFEEGIVDQVYVTTHESFTIVKIIVVTSLEVVVGDKVASVYGQKGIIGAIRDSWELPFTCDGTVPDLFINPLCLPSRMTIPTIMETLFGLVAIETGAHYRVTTFDPIVDIRESMRQLKLDPSGCTRMIHPRTGKYMVPIFCGPQYYNRLGHLAESKCYARARGIMSKHTRQPTDGRSRQGGLRVGEMERDCMIGLGLPHVLEDRLFYCSDPFYINICTQCKFVALNRHLCLCGSTSVQRVKCSFTSNLIFAQLRAMGAKMLFGVEDVQRDNRSMSVPYDVSDNEDKSSSESVTTYDDDI